MILLPDSYSIRDATAGDVALIARHRAAMFRDMGDVDESGEETLRRNSEPWLAGLFAADAYRGWIVDFGGEPVCGGGAWLRELPPRPGCLAGGRWALVMNVYTDPAHRRRGLAKVLMAEVIAWCSINADQVTLAASKEGRPLYEQLGFVATNDMRLRH
jgi:GNAT superfamily N-acetyltransferase